MKKTSFLFGALALFAMSFTACKDTEPEVIIEDGFYVGGVATGADALNVDYRLTAGTNEVTKLARPGMYEKYVALEANKDFYLLLKEGAVETRYGATLTNKELKGENDQPGTPEKPFIIQKGSLVVGATAPALKVTKSGLYHILLDLNLSKDLDLAGGAQIIIAPVEWGVRGVNGEWGWKKMKSPTAFNRTTMVWDTTIVATKDGKFKFAYGGGWKIQLDDAGKVKAETNLGTDLKSGGADISIDKGDNVNIKLTWKLASGDISKSYSVAYTASKWYYDEVAKAKFSLIGSAFEKSAGTPAAWDTDLDLPYVASKSTITDATKFYGTYVFEKAGVVLLANGEFKIRRDMSWDINFGYSAANIKGVGASTNFADNGGNIKVVTAGTYDVQFKYTTPAKTWELTLTKK
jgi:hypothetical protein